MRKVVTVAIGVLTVLTVCMALPSPVLADDPVGGFDRDNFERIAEGGFGDPMNNYAWSMGYFNGDLYVGVGRNSTWGVINGMGLPSEITDIIYEEITVPTGAPGSWTFANDMRGEIWRYHDGEWERVYQAFVFHPPAQPPGVFVCTEIGFRGPMVTFTDKWGEEAIYASRAGAVPPMDVILKSTDGVTWERVRTPSFPCGDSPPYMGTPRAMMVHNGKLYVGAGEAGAYGGGPYIWATDDPVSVGGACVPSHNWELVADFSGFGPGTNTAVGSLASFNGYLYAGVDNPETGFQVFRSNAQSPDDPSLASGWTQIVNYGAGDMHNWRAACMDVLDNQLYVGSLSLPGVGGDAPGFMLPKGFEIIRINPYPDDSWELVVGDYFPLVPPDGVTPRVPISGWPGGFGNFLNFYCWSMQAHEDVLYVGSFDASVFLRFVPIGELIDLELTEEQQGQIVAALEQVIEKLEELGVDEDYIEPFRQLREAFLPVYEPVDWEEVWQIFMDYFAGADLWKTEDGIIWQPVTLNGFDHPDNYGFRNMVGVNPLFIGTANPFDGLEIWQVRGEAGSTDEAGVARDVFTVTDDVYATGSGFPPNTDINVYVIADLAWSDGDPIPADVGDGMNTITTDDNGNCGPDVVWQAPLTPGAYDLVFDVNQNGVYNFIGDYIDDPNHPGFVVLTCPAADFIATPTSGPAPLTVQFTDLSTGDITSWLWHFGDGGISPEQNPSHIYNYPGTYPVNLTVTGPGGTDMEVKTDYIEVFTAVEPARIIVCNLQIQPAQAYPGQQVVVSADVVNQGGVRGSKRIDLVINGQAEQSTRVGVDPGAAKHITFYTSKTVPGTYEVFIEGQASAFNVLLRPHVTSTGAAGGLGTGAIIAIVVIGVIFLVGIIIAFMRARRPA
ncbi:MAG: PKD domain-containing protein [Dehalococcoidales bacterium]|nr:PKD domain-containing protein [Dehalococcoidales bacterium]